MRIPVCTILAQSNKWLAVSWHNCPDRIPILYCLLHKHYFQFSSIEWLFHVSVFPNNNTLGILQPLLTTTISRATYKKSINKSAYIQSDGDLEFHHSTCAHVERRLVVTEASLPFYSHYRHTPTVMLISYWKNKRIIRKQS